MLAEGVERDELRAAASLEGEPCTAEHVAAEPRGRAC
jgi:hypothetical protein